MLGVRSGASWDEVRVRLVPGQKPEDFDEKARELAVARGVARCQVRELKANVVSIDFQRRNLLVDTVWCRDLADLVDVAGSDVDLKSVWSGRTDYGTDWHQSLVGSHTLHAGVTGAGKGAQMWCPLVSIAPAIRDGLVRLSGIDPKGMELAYGRRIFARYAVTGKDALALLDELVAVMDKRKAEFAGRLRSVPISREQPARDRGVRRDRGVDPLHRRPQTPGGHRRTRRPAHHPRPGVGVHGARLRPRTHQGHRPRAGTVPAPDLSAGRHQVPRRDGAR